MQLFDPPGMTAPREQPRPLSLSERELAALAVVVHDLRSPLTSIMLLSEVLADRLRGGSDPLACRHADTIHDAAAAMRALVSDLRDVGRGMNALLDARVTSFSLAPVIAAVQTLVGPAAEAKGITLRVVAPARLRVTGYPSALTRILLNVVTNSVKFTTTGSVELRVRGDADHVVFIVRDSGCGLPAQIVALLAGHLAPVTVGSGKYAGELSAGLGLKIAAGLTRLIGGALAVRDTSAHGTVIELSIPRVADAKRVNARPADVRSTDIAVRRPHIAAGRDD